MAGGYVSTCLGKVSQGAAGSLDGGGGTRKEKEGGEGGADIRPRVLVSCCNEPVFQWQLRKAVKQYYLDCYFPHHNPEAGGGT